MSYQIIKHLEFNAWANKRIAEVVAPLEEETIFKEQKSSFASIGKTLLHIWDAEVIWKKRMEGLNLDGFPSKNFQGAKNDLLNGFTNSSIELVTFIKSKPEDFINTSFDYKTLKGDNFSNTVEETLFHVVNHGTYHRGQIITLLREAGITNLVSTDLIYYLRV